MEYVYINDKFVERDKATVSVFDRGFLFSDGIYELVPVVEGCCFTEAFHLQRLVNGLAAIHITSPHTVAEWITLCEQFIEQNKTLTQESGSIYIQVTRGNQGRRQHQPEPTLAPTVVMFWMPLQETPKHYFTKGIRAITIADKRRRECYFKATGLLPNILAGITAQQQDCEEAIQLNNGWVQEGTMSNVFIVTNNTLITPPLTEHILPGVTRALVIGTAKRLSIPCFEQPISKQTLHHADEVWVTGSRKEIYPITTLDHQPVGDGSVGRMWQTLHQEFQRWKKQTIHNKSSTTP